MRFAEAEKEYRELEARFARGELPEDDFLALAAQLRVIDREGRRWMISGSTGRWTVYDGQKWVESDPPREPEPEPETALPPTPEPEAPKPVVAAPARVLQPRPIPSGPARPGHGRVLAVGAAALILVACLAASAAATWVFFLRGKETPQPTAAAGLVDVSVVSTFTPRPATPTYTPTFTPTPSETPPPTITPIPTDTPFPTVTPIVTATEPPTPLPTLAVPTAMPTTAPSATPGPTVASAPLTYKVKKGDTLWTIAERFGISVNDLIKANGLAWHSVLHADQVLIIPTAGSSATPAATTGATATAKPASTAAKTAVPTATKAGPSPTPKPTTAPTSAPSALQGKIAFTVWNTGAGKYDLYVSRIDGGGRNMLGTGFRQPQFRPDGNLLAVNGEGANNMEHLVTMDANGDGKVVVSQHTEDSYPSWHRAGGSLVFSSTSYDRKESRLGIVLDLAGRGWNWIPSGTTEIRGSYPFWASNGRIVYHGCDFLVDYTACGLYWVAETGGEYHRITMHNSDTAPAVSGTRIAFMSSRDGNWEVYAVNMDGSGLKRLTNNGAEDGLPTWSPDGKSIAFASRRDGQWAIWVMNADGGSQRKLFNLEGGYGSGGSDWTTERISWAP